MFWMVHLLQSCNFQDLWADANRSPAEGRGASPPPRSGSLVKSGRFSKWAFSSWRTSWTFSCLALYSCKQNRCRLTSSQWLECTAISFFSQVGDGLYIFLSSKMLALQKYISIVLLRYCLSGHVCHKMCKRIYRFSCWKNPKQEKMAERAQNLSIALDGLLSLFLLNRRCLPRDGIEVCCEF